MQGTLYRRSESILFGDIGDDIVALSMERGLCYGMENVAGAVWTLLEQPRSLEQLCEVLIQEYDVDPQRCHSEVSALLAEMEAEGLVSRAC